MSKSPNLIINRVVVKGNLTCDYTFNEGINIIQSIASNDLRDSNKTGKTALIELIQHGFGKRQKNKEKYHFKPIINDIETMWLEFTIINKVFTLERSLRKLTSDLIIREGQYHERIQEISGTRIPRDEISLNLLQLLGIPFGQVKTKEGGLSPLTFFQLYRTFILHQEDSFSAILDKVQPETRKKDIIGFITGIISTDRFTLEKELSDIQLKRLEKESYFGSIKNYLLSNNIPSISEAQGLVKKARSLSTTAQQRQLELQSQIREDSDIKQIEGEGRLSKLRRDLTELKLNESNSFQIKRTLEIEYDRIQSLLMSLKGDISKAEKIITSSRILSSVDFDICPRCLLDVTEEMRLREEYARCSLCNRSLSVTSDTPPRAVGKLEDIDFQIHETEEILADINNDREQIDEVIQNIKEKISILENTVEIESREYIAPSVDILLNEAQIVSRLETELVLAEEIERQAENLEKIRQELESLEAEENDLNHRLSQAKYPNQEKINLLRDIYRKILIEIEFPNFNDCSIDRNSLMPYINGDLYVHQGVAYKGLAATAFHIALFEYSLQYDSYFPSILVVDSPSVGDLNEDSYTKLLSYIFKLHLRLEELNISWQLILTTRDIIPELKPLVLDKLSNPDNMLLKSSK